MASSQLHSLRWPPSLHCLTCSGNEADNLRWRATAVLVVVERGNRRPIREGRVAESILPSLVFCGPLNCAHMGIWQAFRGLGCLALAYLPTRCPRMAPCPVERERGTFDSYPVLLVPPGFLKFFHAVHIIFISNCNIAHLYAMCRSVIVLLQLFVHSLTCPILYREKWCLCQPCEASQRSI